MYEGDWSSEFCDDVVLVIQEHVPQIFLLMLSCFSLAEVHCGTTWMFASFSIFSTSSKVRINILIDIRPWIHTKVIFKT